MIVVFFCVCMYSIAKVDKQKTPELWFFVTLAWIAAVALVTGSGFSPVFGFLCAFASLWAKKLYAERKPPLY